MKVLLKITMKGIYMVQAEMVMFITSKVKNKFTILWTPERPHQRIVRKKSDLHFLKDEGFAASGSSGVFI